MKSILSLTLLACLLCIAHSWHMPGRHPTPTAEESDLCTLHGKYSTKLCWISQKDGIEESRTWYGKKRRSVDCSCFGEGGEEAAEDVAKEIGRAISQYPISPPPFSSVTEM